MKRRFLLLLVSFFAMTSMWASLKDAYKLYLTGAATAKQGGTVTLNFNMKNAKAVNQLQAALALPEGWTVTGVAAVNTRYSEDFNGTWQTSANNVALSTEAGAVTAGDGVVATVTLSIPATATLGETSLKVTSAVMFAGDLQYKGVDQEFKLTIEEAATLKGDVDGDGQVGVGDINAVLELMASGTSSAAGDVDGDGQVGVGDINAVLEIMAGN